jgi:hypothetical protein
MHSAEVQLLVTENMRTEIDRLKSLSVDNGIVNALFERVKTSITLTDLRLLCDILPGKNSLQYLVKGSKLVFTKESSNQARYLFLSSQCSVSNHVNRMQPSLELIKRRDFLRGQSERRAYADMVGGSVE